MMAAPDRTLTIATKVVAVCVPIPRRPGSRRIIAAIPDNLPSHKVVGVRKAVEAMGARLLFLPLYSLDLNPIEQIFAKPNTLLPSEAVRTIEALWAAVGRLLARFAAAGCARHLVHCGYGRPG
jgi:hypothetical protein